jgi:hypothetical protein
MITFGLQAADLSDVAGPVELDFAALCKRSRSRDTRCATPKQGRYYIRHLLTRATPTARRRLGFGTFSGAERLALC